MKAKISLAGVSGLLLLSLVSGGCGSDSTTSGNFAPQDVGPLVTTPSTLTGKVSLGNSFAGAEVSLVGLNNQVLAQTTSDSTGNFQFPNYLGPANFRVVAKVGANQFFGTEVRNYQGGGRYVVINVPTSIVSAFLAGHPGADPAEVDAKVHRLFNLPAEKSLEYGIEESVRAPFSHCAFFAAAAAAGGWDAYRTRLLTDLENSTPPGTSHLLTRARAALSLSGLDPALAAHINALRNTGRIRLGLRSFSARPVPDMAALILGDAITRPNTPQPGVSPRIVDTVIDQVRDVVWTHIADALNLNYGTTTKLDNIQESLNLVLDILNELESELSQGYLTLLTGQIQLEVSDIQTYTGTLAFPSVTSQLPNVNTPYATALGAFFAELVAINVVSDSATIHSQLPSIVASARNSFTGDLGMMDDGTCGYVPLRTNAILDYLQQELAYYTQVQQLAGNIVGEAAHVKNVNPYSELASAQNNAIVIANQIKDEIGLLPPYLPSDEIVVDVQTGLMWYWELQAADSVSGANAAASNFTKEYGGRTYDDWHLAQANELNTLQNRGRFVASGLRNTDVEVDGSSTDYGDYGHTAQGLGARVADASGNYADLLFTRLDQFTDNDADVLQAEWTYDDPVFGDSHWDLNNTGSLDRNTTYQFNHSYTPSTDSDHVPYLIVRHLTTPVVKYTENDNYGYPWATSTMTAGEVKYFGNIASIGSVVLSNQTQLGATINWLVNIGGSFKMGSTSNSASYSLSTQAPTGSNQTLNNGVPNELQELVSFTRPDSQQGLLTVLPNGKVLWHVTSSTSQTASITAAARSAQNLLRQVTSSVTASAPPARTLLQVQLFPRNRIYTVPVGNPTATEQYSALAFYSDNTVQDVTSTATFTLTDSNHNPVDPTKAFFSSSGNGLLEVTDGSPNDLLISVSIGSDASQKDVDVKTRVNH